MKKWHSVEKSRGYIGKAVERRSMSLFFAFICFFCKPHLSRVVRKPAFCICENKDADQLRGNREADQRLCFRYTDSTIPLLPKSKISKPLAIFCGCTAWFVSDLVGNPEDRFSHNEGHLLFFITLPHCFYRVQRMWRIVVTLLRCFLKLS